MPVYIDGLLSARAYVSGETVFLPPEAVCAAAGMSMSWSEDNGTLTLSVPGAVLTGLKGSGYFEADGRYIYAPDGWLVKGDVLYLPSDAIERLFGVSVSVSAKRDGWSFRLISSPSYPAGQTIMNSITMPSCCTGCRR